MDPEVTSNAFIYDAQLIEIDESNRSLIFNIHGTYSVPVSDISHWQVGSVGRLQLPSPDHSFSFYIYPDPLLRRVPSMDDTARGVWGWRIGDRRFTIKAGVVPGKAGAFISRDTELLEIDLPREFLQLAADCGLEPITILRDFVANLCSLMNYCACPREDGYSSSGSDERQFAKDYFRRTYGWVFYRSASAVGKASNSPPHFDERSNE